MRATRIAAAVGLVLVLTGCDTSPGFPAPAGPERPDSLAGMILFVSDRTGQPELYGVRPDGTGLVRLTDGSLAGVEDPAVSPDGRTVAFTARPPEAPRPDIFLMNADGSDLRQFTPQVPDEAPAWSPDGARLALHRFTDNGYDLFVINLDGSGQVQLTTDPSNEADPAWSPDGTGIAFEGDGTGDAEIYVMRTDGSDVRRLTSRPGDDLFPAWSPDGERVAFVGDGPDGGRDIWIVRANGSDALALASPGADDDPSWSPDGEEIAFDSTDDGGSADLFVVDVDGSRMRRLTHDAADEEQPCWVPV
jgi:Tol biopolymer transport system component